MQDGRGKAFKIVIISMMVVIFLSMGLSSIMYLGGNKEATQTGQNLEENTLTGEEFTGSLETGNLINTGDLVNTGNLELTGN